MKRVMPTLLSWACLLGCAGPAVVTDSWPHGIPPRTYYERLWEADPTNQTSESRLEYLGWVESFYRGSVLAQGWGRLQETLESDLSGAEFVIVSPKLRFLGELISGEWAKHNTRRRITSAMLVIWGRAMGQAKARGRIDRALDGIFADVQGLLRGQVSKEDIVALRYECLRTGEELTLPR